MTDLECRRDFRAVIEQLKADYAVLGERYESLRAENERLLVLGQENARLASRLAELQGDYTRGYDAGFDAYSAELDRLRARVAELEEGNIEEQVAQENTRLRAEIERLRTQSIELKGLMADAIRADNERLRAENEQLRKGIQSLPIRC